MKRLTLYIGHNVDGEPSLKVKDIRKAIEATLKPESYTLIPALGCWEGDHEDTSICIISGLTNAQAVELSEKVEELRMQLEQDEIFVEKSDIDAQRVRKENTKTEQKTA